MTSPEFAVDDSAADQTAPRTIDHSQLPTLYVDGSFWGMTITQFFGAFNDNLFKQLILLVAVGLSAAAAAESGGALNKQGIAMLVFALPFVLFSTFAGFVSDRVSKTRVIRLAKVGEIMVMTLGLAAFVAFQLAGFKGLCVVLFLMGTQSAFFGPGKYGILPEMLREADLPRANGFFLMTTFLAIIFGTASAGWLADLVAGREPTDADPSTIDPNRLWIVSILCVAVAIAGACSSLLVRKLPPANPDLRFHGSMLAIPADMRALLAGDSLLLVTLLVSSSFWLMGGIVQPTVNEFGIDQLQQDNEKTSYLAAAMGVGIAIGCMTAGLMSRDRVRFGLARVGLYGMLGCLILLGIPAPHAPHQHLWGYRGS
ncbi:MAG: MFS transporter, partial [Planctomycetota bacterium]